MYFVGTLLPSQASLFEKDYLTLTSSESPALLKGLFLRIEMLKTW